MITPILGLRFTPNVKPTQKTQSVTLKPQLSADTVCFGSTRAKDDLMSLSDGAIFKKVKEAIENGELIGEGGEGQVYKIGDSGYCVKKSSFVELKDLKSLKSKFTKKVTEQDKVNHIVAKYANSVTIMPIIEGSPVLSLRMSESEIYKVSEQICTLPKSAFSALLHQLSDAYDKDMVMDCLSANVIVDSKNKKLTAIDFYRNDPDAPEAARHLAYIYASMVHEYTTEAQHKIIAEKVMNAGLEEFKPGVKPCCHFDYFGFGDLIRVFADLELFDNKKYIKLLSTLTNRIRDLKYQEIRGVDVTNELNGEIKKVQAIMRQLAKS